MNRYTISSTIGASGSLSLKVLLGTLLIAGAAFASAGSWADDADASGHEFADDFESYQAGRWSDGSTNGASWYVEYNGYGKSGITANKKGTKRHYQKPQASSKPDETHASMVVSTETFEGVDMTVRQKTVKQLRTGSKPNPWEVAWVVWGHSDDEHFYYFVLKPNGIELGKVDPGCADGGWGGQCYLYGAGNPKLTIGDWNSIRVRQVGATIDVWVDGNHVVKGVTDTPALSEGTQPHLSGSIGMYNEDAYVMFDDITASSTSL